MDIEQLKLILDAAAAAGGGATKIIIMWFGYKLFVAVLHYGLFASLFYVIYRIVTAMIGHFSTTGKIREIIGYFNPECSDHVSRVLYWVRERQNEHPWEGTRHDPWAKPPNSQSLGR